MRFDPDRGIVVEGIVARNLPEHPVGPRPARAMPSVAFNDLAGNTALTMFLGEFQPGGTKCGHRHFDETLMLFLTGSGHTELSQSGDEPVCTDWSAGDVVAIPCNAWHKHFNASQTEGARVLSFKSGTAFTSLVGPEAKAQLAEVRLRDRFDDEPDVFTRRDVASDGTVRAATVGTSVEALPPADPNLGSGVSLQTYELGGHRALGVALLGIAAGGRTSPHRPYAEEALYILAGHGRTDLWSDDGQRTSVAWAQGDLISSPLGIWRMHLAESADVRLLRVRVDVIGRVLATGGAPLDAPLPDRWPDVAEPPDGLGDPSTWILR